MSPRNKSSVHANPAVSPIITFPQAPWIECNLIRITTFCTTPPNSTTAVRCIVGTQSEGSSAGSCIQPVEAHLQLHYTGGLAASRGVDLDSSPTPSIPQPRACDIYDFRADVSIIDYVVIVMSNYTTKQQIHLPASTANSTSCR